MRRSDVKLMLNDDGHDQADKNVCATDVPRMRRKRTKTERQTFGFG